MKIVKKTKQIEYEVYITSDGKEFTSKTDAQLHEDKLNGNKKECLKQPNIIFLFLIFNI